MKPRGMLMIEHRLIEKMLVLAGEELARGEASGRVDPVFVDTVVDFIRTYADRTHHGKEEDILFADLEKRTLSSADGRLMASLIEDHRTARRAVGEIVNANRSYAAGDAGGLKTIAEKVRFLTVFYPEHIRKEDEVFFPNAEKYLSPAELDRMVTAFLDFDRKMIHEKYNKLYENLKVRFDTGR
jgi:hemerythrin-like domain-containing protein